MKNWSQYLGKSILCECQKVHTCDIRYLVIAENAVEQLPGYLKEEGFQRVCLVMDCITEKIMGKTVEHLLRFHYITYSKILLTQKEPLPNETAIQQITEQLPSNCELIIAIGGGTITDLCKYVSFQKELPYFIVPTAPSMDGYASNVAAMLLHNTKTTIEVEKPMAIFADTMVLAQAPMNLVAAGVGDMLGKYVCLADWELSHLVTGEYNCSYVRDIMKSALREVVQALPALAERKPEAIEALMEGLLLSGIAMSYLGNSRPASGSEHHLSHFWEMAFLQQHKPAVLHGAKVGIGTVLALSLYREAEVFLSQEELPENRMESTNWVSEIKRVYGDAADSVLALEQTEKKNSPQAVAIRLSVVKRKRAAILELIHQLPQPEEIIAWLQLLSAPSSPAEIGLDEVLVRDGIYYAKELRNRYGILQLLYDMEKTKQTVDTLLSQCRI